MRGGCDPPTTLALPSKRSSWHAPPGALIFRSDSNGEDLPDYAGAGLHDSIPYPPLAARTTDLAADCLVWDAAARTALFATLAAVGVAVEGASGDGGAVDVEGCVVGGEVVVVQARRQIV